MGLVICRKNEVIIPNYVPCNYLFISADWLPKILILLLVSIYNFLGILDSIPPESGGTNSSHMLSPEHIDQFLLSHVWIDCFSALLSSNSLLKHNSDPFGAGDFLVFFGFSVLRKQLDHFIDIPRVSSSPSSAWFCNQCWESKPCMNSSAFGREGPKQRSELCGFVS